MPASLCEAPRVCAILGSILSLVSDDRRTPPSATTPHGSEVDSTGGLCAQNLEFCASRARRIRRVSLADARKQTLAAAASAAASSHSNSIKDAAKALLRFGSTGWGKRYGSRSFDIGLASSAC